MEAFAANEYDVLVATTIIESGIDNPHSNTLVIEDSQRLGLAQLYQLKGRVGRSHVKAYAYFLFPAHQSLTEQAIERLTAIGENTELGSGIKIAMRDLEIRGAGSLLGAEQSGNLSAVGFDLFAQMLREAVSEARGEPVVAHPEIRVDLPVPAFLPEEYVDAVDERVRVYRRLAGSPSIEAVDAVFAEMEERFGAGPGAGEEPRQRRAHPGDGRRGRRDQRQRRAKAPDRLAAEPLRRRSAASSRPAVPCGSNASESSRCRSSMESL